ncbi:protein DYAD [Eucalyptus grandis]|uniref:protein DYAD n=1 Tax=Eucalyptus grandis TaxID=71139 RepID=UPI00192EE445|nr:protein DYAD [Eucalyptus grandis]
MAPRSLSLSLSLSHVSAGFFYEIDHDKLSSKHPEQLKLVRVAMVSEKAGRSVSLRFPSIYSLRKHFSSGDQTDRKKTPALDEKYVLGSEIAGQLLRRRIAAAELAEKKSSWGFWAYGRTASSPAPVVSGSSTGIIAKKGSCWSELECNGMVRWGKRRQVRFLSRHAENNDNLRLLSQSVEHGRPEKEKETTEGQEIEVEKSPEVKEKEDEEEEDEVKEDEAKEDEEDEEEAEASTEIIPRKIPKRKCKGQKRTRASKRAKRDQKPQAVKVHSHVKRKGIRGSIERWSAERYKLAERNMLKILKEKRAVAGNPILRPALRSEARKLIGDTGLLDHLLKHMAGKLAPGGAERFRRRHNADGAMEYWLESANLVEVRKAAGVEDPYWTPPPGWKPGDNPTRDPTCAREIKQLKEEMANLKRDMQELVSQKQEEDLVVETTPTSCMSCLNLDHDSPLVPMKEMYVELKKRKATMEDQLREVSQLLCAMEPLMIRVLTFLAFLYVNIREKQWMKQQETMETLKLKTAVESRSSQESEETTMPSSTMNPRTKGSSETESELGAEERKKKLADAVRTDESEKGPEGQEQEDKLHYQDKITATITTGIEDKAAKIERLKSGFRICKPQGTFLWPSTTTSPPSELVLSVQDLLVAPTPPSVSSSTTSPPLLPTSPVKPLAEKRLVNLAALPTTTIIPTHLLSVPMTSPRSLINLNEVPTSQNIRDCSRLCTGISIDNSDCIPSSSLAALTYKRRPNGSVLSPSSSAPVPAVSCAASSAVAGTGRTIGDEPYPRIDDARRGIMSSDPIDRLGVSSPSMSPPSSSSHYLSGTGLLPWLESHS